MRASLSAKGGGGAACPSCGLVVSLVMAAPLGRAPRAARALEDEARRFEDGYVEVETVRAEVKARWTKRKLGAALESMAKFATAEKPKAMEQLADAMR